MLLYFSHLKCKKKPETAKISLNGLYLDICNVMKVLVKCRWARECPWLCHLTWDMVMRELVMELFLVVPPSYLTSRSLLLKMRSETEFLLIQKNCEIKHIAFHSYFYVHLKTKHIQFIYFTLLSRAEICIYPVQLCKEQRWRWGHRMCSPPWWIPQLLWIFSSSPTLHCRQARTQTGNNTGKFYIIFCNTEEKWL